MSVEDTKAEFEAILSKSSWWSRFIGSQFVSYLSLFISQFVDRASQTCERLLQESFLSLATKRTSILAGAEDVMYVPRKISPSTGQGRITNTGTERIALSELTQCVAANQVRYTIMESIALDPNESLDVTLNQMEIETITMTVEEQQDWLSISFDVDLTARIHKAIVYVNGEMWTESFKFRYATSESKVYMEYYKSTDQLGIRFGNGVSGISPAAGDVISIDLWLTEGDTTLLNDQKLTIVETDPGSSTSVSISTVSQITGGDVAEDIESIRNGALYSTIYDNQIAWDGDYQGFIKSNISSIVWLSVWGEKEQELLAGKKDLGNINTIFISAYSSKKSDEELDKEILALFDGREGYNESYKYVTRKDAPFTVTVDGIVFDSSNAQDVTKAVSDKLSSLYGKDVSPGAIYVKSIWSAVESVAKEQGIDEYTVTCEGLLDTVPIDTFQYLDIDASTITFNYRKA
ncbi:hypothetical protein [Vibrio marisflavi]|uniref:Baseplate protein J-like domain-containing protein n=1 Tax=Vibrio marisflavi CECT 7928 TaxID=634439 RepID=A0ABM9A9F5_9VIBR|nr:hypothetical protein [Vibrio marisflavi]CAH0543060.1 hypothetical protein VMF7928_04382 [Vibrio marisflavi CECT 7928]